MHRGHKGDSKVKLMESARGKRLNINLFDRIHSFTASGAFFLCAWEHTSNSARGPCLRTNEEEEDDIRENFNVSKELTVKNQIKKHLPAQDLICQPQV